MTTIYIPGFSAGGFAPRLRDSIPWLRVAETRSECFLAESRTPLSYTYGTGRGVRTYTSVPMIPFVRDLMGIVNEELWRYGWDPMNVCFLNMYLSGKDHLGWHSDDHPGTDHTRPIAVLSYGQAREIWWRPTGEPGVVPPERRQLLGDGSLFIMPPGMQFTHEHRIPKGDREMGMRISLTFRAFLPG